MHEDVWRRIAVAEATDILRSRTRATASRVSSAPDTGRMCVMKRSSKTMSLGVCGEGVGNGLLRAFMLWHWSWDSGLERLCAHFCMRATSLRCSCKSSSSYRLPSVSA